MKKSVEIFVIAVLLARPLALPAQTTPGGVGPSPATMPHALQSSAAGCGWHAAHAFLQPRPRLRSGLISFDPRDTPERAAEKKKAALSRFGRRETESGWHFLTGGRESIDRVTQAADFRYIVSAKTNLFAHASGVLLLTPDGRISRYFYGVEYPGRDMRLGLVDASEGKIGTPIDHVLLFCYQYDPSTATYRAAILKLVRQIGRAA